MVLVATLLNKICGGNFKTLPNAYGWGYDVCYEELDKGGCG